MGSDSVVYVLVSLGVPYHFWNLLGVGSDWDRSSRVQKTAVISCGLPWCSPKIS